MPNNDQDRHYYSAADIYGVLRALQTDRSSVNIQFAGDTRPYSSLVLEANLRERYFLLDETTPRDGHHRISNGTPFSLRASVNGIRVHAGDLKSLRTLNDHAGSSYMVAFPERMLYLQRRDAFRASVPGRMTSIASLRSGIREGDLHGRIVNLSAEGIKIAFPGHITPALTTGEHCNLRLLIQPQEPVLECEAEVVYCEYSPENDRSICGCRLINMPLWTQRLVNRFVTFLQHEA